MTDMESSSTPHIPESDYVPTSTPTTTPADLGKPVPAKRATRKYARTYGRPKDVEAPTRIARSSSPPSPPPRRSSTPKEPEEDTADESPKRSHGPREDTVDESPKDTQSSQPPSSSQDGDGVEDLRQKFKIGGWKEKLEALDRAPESALPRLLAPPSSTLTSLPTSTLSPAETSSEAQGANADTLAETSSHPSSLHAGTSSQAADTDADMAPPSLKGRKRIDDSEEDEEVTVTTTARRRPSGIRKRPSASPSDEDDEGRKTPKGLGDSGYDDGADVLPSLADMTRKDKLGELVARKAKERELKEAKKQAVVEMSDEEEEEEEEPKKKMAKGKKVIRGLREHTSMLAGWLTELGLDRVLRKKSWSRCTASRQLCSEVGGAGASKPGLVS
jgi:hypothetical protein